MNNTKIILLDSNSLINRAYYALPPMRTKDGIFTNAVYGYMAMLAKLIAEEKPTHICAVFDCHAKTFRHQKYAAYKGTRKPMPEELVQQVPMLQELLQTMGIKLLFKEGWEADDIIGTLAKRFDLPTVIVSGDRDVLQLVDETTTVFHTKRGVSDIKEYTPRSLSEEGFTPQQIIEYKALAGDASDNIPGARGVGEKTAKDLLAQYGNVDAIYAHIDEIKGKLREKLTESYDSVLLSKDLATIDTQADIPCTLEELEYPSVFPDKAKEIMARWEFKNLMNRFSFDTAVPPQKTEQKSGITVSVDTVDDCKKELAFIREGDVVAVDWGQTVSLTSGEKTIVLILTEGMLGEGIGEDDAVSLIAPYLSERYTTIVFDAKKAFYTFSRLGVAFRPPYEDIFLAAYLVNNTKVIKNKASLMSDYGYGENTTSAEILSLWYLLQQKLSEFHLYELYEKVEKPLTECLYTMEKAGFLIDTDTLTELGKSFSEELDGLTEEIHRIANDNFNINSSKQLADILFNKLRLQPLKKNKTGYSVSAEVLEELEHPIVDALLRYRQLSKLKSTYIDGMRAVMNPYTKRVHTEFNQCLTATGRLSSSEPNLQNIPVRTADGKEIRKMFIPSPNNVLISADYSQIELRLLAHFSQDENLLESYKNGGDIHALTASKIFRTPLKQVTSEMRRSAKAVNFGIIYGISAFGLAKNAGVTSKQAKRFIDDYFATYPKVSEYMSANVALAKKQGYLTTLLGRIRYFPELTSPQYNTRSFGERAAMNFPLQGTASDIIKLAMLRVQKALSDGGFSAKMILQVHDELILDCPEEECEQVKELLCDCMRNAVTLSVPLEVGVASGRTWYDAK